MPIRIDNKFNIKDFVYVVTDPEQHRGVVIAILVHDEKHLTYRVSIGTESQEYYDFELSADKDVLAAI